MYISLIVAMSQNRVIGRDGDLPWRLSADLRRFKRLTMGHPLVMGRKTFESIGRPLPGRTMIVITRQDDYSANEVAVVHSLKGAIEFAKATGDDEVFIIGGGEIYRQAIDVVDRIYLTRVAAEIDGDTFFPEFALDDWQLIEAADYPSDDKNDRAHTFQIYHRNRHPEPSP